MKAFFITVLTLSALFAGKAHASIISFGFEVSNFTPFAGVNNTDVMTGQFSFDTTIPDPNDAGLYPNIVRFDYSSPFITGSGTFGGIAVFPHIQQYRIQFNPSSGPDAFLNGDKLTAMNFTFGFPLGTIVDTSLFLTPPDISQTLSNAMLNGRILNLAFMNPTTSQRSNFFGEVTSLTYLSTVEPSTVPEPAPLALLGLGLVGLGVIRRRKA